MGLAILVLLSFCNIGFAVGTNFFPLMAWNGAPGDPVVLEKMRECGLMIAGFITPRDLDTCHAADLKAIVSDPRVSEHDWMKLDEAMARKNIESLVADVGKHPAVMGYYLRDEPYARHFPGLGKVASLIHELDPGKWGYINLFPNYASTEQLGSPNYTAHLEGAAARNFWLAILRIRTARATCWSSIKISTSRATVTWNFERRPGAS